MYSDISKKIKIEFSDFLLRKYKITLKRNGNLMSVLEHNKLVAQFFIIKTKNYIRLKKCKNEIPTKIEEIVRFKLSIRNSIPVIMNENQCTQFNCFDKLIKEFEADWLIFNGIECNYQSDFISKKNDSEQTTKTTSTKKSGKVKNINHGLSSPLPSTTNINIKIDPIKVEPIKFNNSNIPNQNITVDAKFPKDMKMILDILDDFQKKLTKVSLT